MDAIEKILEKDTPSLAELIHCFEAVKEKGDIALIKFDGERTEKHYTVLITFPVSKKKEMIRADEDSLEIALIKVLKKYVAANQ